MDMALVGDTLVKTTTNGEATFTLALEGAPLMGTYTIGFEPGALGWQRRHVGVPDRPPGSMSRTTLR